MRIKRLEICGFKSFMDRAVFAFDEGITGILGPNGCGKSNVVDAIRWRCEHRPSTSRPVDEDVIFNGSDRRPAAVDASDDHFSNDNPRLLRAVPGFSELSVDPPPFRSGDSEYFNQKTPCRLLDVTELFLGTGVGTKAYSIRAGASA